jgi:hypothetical protein
MQTCLPPLFDLIRPCPCCLPWATTALLSPDSNFAERACSCARGHSSQGGASLTRAASPIEPALGNKREPKYGVINKDCERYLLPLMPSLRVRSIGRFRRSGGRWRIQSSCMTSRLMREDEALKMAGNQTAGEETLLGEQRLQGVVPPLVLVLVVE